MRWTLPHTFTSKPGKEEEFGHFSIVQRVICKARQLWKVFEPSKERKNRKRKKKLSRRDTIKFNPPVEMLQYNH